MIGKKVKVTGGPGIQIRYEGVFDLDRLYKESKDWFSDNDYDFQEKEYTDKVKDKGHEIVFKFIGEKEVTDYFKFNINAEFNLTEVNSMSDNLVKGKVEIFLKADLELDYRNKWQHTKFLEFLFKIYNNYIIKERIHDYADKLEEEVIELQDLIRDILDFNR